MVLNNASWITLFVKQVGDETYLMSLYVDDILIAGSNEDEIDKIKKEFTERYEMKDLGELNHYLGMKITRTDEYNIISKSIKFNILKMW